MGNSKEYGTRGQIGQLGLMCHIELRRKVVGEAGVGGARISKGRMVIFMEIEKQAFCKQMFAGTQRGL